MAAWKLWSKPDETQPKGIDVDFPLVVYGEKKMGAGEDSYYFAVAEDLACVAALDGCGGSGARRYEKCQGKTGAYLASRIVSGAVRDWFMQEDLTQDEPAMVEAFHSRTKRYLSLCQEAGGNQTRIRGSLAKELPTTCALVVLRKKGLLWGATSIWAGDSRCYLLDMEGLHQLTTDDLGGLDAMRNLSADGVLTNVLDASGEYELHHRSLVLSGPCILFAATDGCFGYLSTPMEFEYLLLDTLCASKSVSEWESRLSASFNTVAGDDYTLCGAALGFGGFDRLASSFQRRKHEVLERYIRPTRESGGSEVATLWEQYRAAYEVYL